MKLKKVLATILVATMSMSMISGCGSTSAVSESAKASDESTKATSGSTKAASESATDKTTASGSESSTQAGAKTDLSGTKISFLNSKGEIQTALEDMAKEFQKETGIEVEIQACGTGESPYTKITSAYNAGTAPTMAMLDTSDVISLAKQDALDLSDQDWVKECASQVTKIDGKIYSFPFCIEGRGLIYNKTTIEKTLGTTFDPSKINSYDALKSLLEQLQAKGMAQPVVISKEDWSLGAHQLGFIYDTFDGTTDGSAKVIGQLKAGSLKAENYNRFNQFVDTFSLLMKYNINGKDPLGAIYDQDPTFLVDGKAAIWANGTWAWPNLKEAGAKTTDEYGFLPYVLGNDTTDFANTKMQASATKQVMIDKVHTTKQQVAAAEEFLHWIVYTDEGQKMLVQNAAVVPASPNNKYQADDPLGKDMQAKMAAGNTFSSSFIAPSDHWKVLGASMQKYLGGQSKKADLAKDIDTYWTSQK